MKKKDLKKLNLKKKAISNLNAHEINGGASYSIITCLWSCTSCPTIGCTEGDVCDALISLALDELCVDDAR